MGQAYQLCLAAGQEKGLFPDHRLWLKLEMQDQSVPNDCITQFTHVTETNTLVPNNCITHFTHMTEKSAGVPNDCITHFTHITGTNTFVLQKRSALKEGFAVMMGHASFIAGGVTRMLTALTALMNSTAVSRAVLINIFLSPCLDLFRSCVVIC